MEAVYPRSRGELHLNDATHLDNAGLSPLTRGTLRRWHYQRVTTRFIPAHAGNSIKSALRMHCSAVYPRSRGELQFKISGSCNAAGLSPLTRGTRKHGIQFDDVARFIPAHAGNSPRQTLRGVKPPVYPRSRGELDAGSSFRMRSHGLSPLTRGTHEKLRDEMAVIRFIPAHAGNSPRQSTQLPMKSVYPRSRGELIPVLQMPCMTSGLSPLTRGTRLPRRHTWRSISVYPRSRGELCEENGDNADDIGLSPLTRGTRLVSLKPGVEGRFIPARAGNTPSFSSSKPEGAVYPRSRGEHSKTIYLYLLHFFVQQHPTNVWFTISHC